MSADGPAEQSPQQGSQPIEVGAQVLRALEAGRGPMALSEVARNCAMHPAKVHRDLVSLVRAGLAPQDARTGQYDLGPDARHLGVEALRCGGAAPHGRRKHRRGLHLAAEGSDRPYHQRGGVDRERTDHRPLGLGNPRAAAQRAGRFGAAAARLGRRLDVPGAPAGRADRRRAGHPAGPAGDTLPAPPRSRSFWSKQGATGSRARWPMRSAVPPGRSRPNWDTARRNTPVPTRPQRWRR
jgi:hypothetical protein